MKNLFSKTSLAAVSLAAATLLTPAIAQAGNYSSYEKCKDTENAIAGAAVGGTLGAVLGKEIASRDDNTEGAILGAVIGGIAGAAIGDGVNDCEKYNTNSRSRSGYTTVPSRGYSNSGYSSRSGVTTVAHHGGGYNNRGYRDRGYRDDGYGYSDRGYYGNSVRSRIRRIDDRMRDLRRERKSIQKHQGWGRRRGDLRRLDYIEHKLHSLKRERKRLKRVANNRHDYRPTRRGHYHGSTVCYSDH